jgi:hypothetical protein
MVRKGEFELRYHIDNTQFIDSTFGLTAQMPTIPLRLYVYCTENAQRKRKLAKVFCLKPASNSLTSAPSTGGRSTHCSGMPGMATGAKSSQNLVASPVRSEILARTISKWDGPPPFQPAARYKRFVDLSLVNAYHRRKLESACFIVSRRVAANGVVSQVRRAIASVPIA